MLEFIVSITLGNHIQDNCKGFLDGILVSITQFPGVIERAALQHCPVTESISPYWTQLNRYFPPFLPEDRNRSNFQNIVFCSEYCVKKSTHQVVLNTHILFVPSVLWEKDKKMVVRQIQILKECITCTAGIPKSQVEF